jgi:hypothetical protein
MGQYFQVNGDYNIKAKNGGSIILEPSNEVRIEGNLTVTGTSTAVESVDLTVEDNLIVLNKGESSAGVSRGFSGIEIDRGSSTNVALIFDETDPSQFNGGEGTWSLVSGTNGSYNFGNTSNLKLKRILTDGNQDLTLIGSGTGVVNVGNRLLDSSGDPTTGIEYHLLVTDDNDVPNKKYVDETIENNPTFQIVRDDTRVIIGDKDLTPNDILTGGSLAYYNNETGIPIIELESRVGVVIDSQNSVQIFKNRVEFFGGIEINDQDEIVNTNSTGDIYIRCIGNGHLKTNIALELENIGATEPAYVPAITGVGPGSTVIYSGIGPETPTKSAGGSGIYFVSKDNTRDELVSKNRALLFSMIF